MKSFKQFISEATKDDKIMKGLNHISSNHRLKTIRSADDATPEHLYKALQDKDLDVRLSAVSHLNMDEKNLIVASKDKSSFVRQSAALHHKSTYKSLKPLLKDRDANVRGAAENTKDLLDRGEKIPTFYGTRF